MKTRYFFLILAGILSANVHAQTLKPDSIICFDRDDWDEMRAAAIDKDVAGMQRLIFSGACRVIEEATQVTYLDPAAGGAGALIQLRSGKTAFTADWSLSP